jgi:hypothetical protein
MRSFRLFSSISHSFSTKNRVLFFFLLAPFLTLKKVTLFPGDGIGPEISASVVQIFDALKVPIEWEVERIDYERKSADGDLISAETLQGLKNNGFGLKGSLKFLCIFEDFCFFSIRWNFVNLKKKLGKMLIKKNFFLLNSSF